MANPENIQTTAGDTGSKQGQVEVRPLLPTDPIAPITALLHRSYASQNERGMKPLAGRQSVEMTRQRCYRGQTFVALRSQGGAPSANFAERLVGTILFQEREDAAFPPWFLRTDVTHFSQFAVEPGLQKAGVGGKLLERAELETLRLGARELALSMAEPDAPLRLYYERRGYRVVQTWQWPYTNYLSLIMSKALVAPAEDA
ncbi:MAG: GNAT family N-acetyltransferase [Phycisphaerales bacterium]|jgi:GNAT superfamily N-acetyltransferase